MNDDDVILLSSLYHVKFSKVVHRNRLSRVSGLYFFILEGICIGLWSMLLPAVSSHLCLTDSELGAAALCTYLGTLLATPIAANIISFLGVRCTALISTLGFCVSLPLVAKCDTYPVLLFAMLTFGTFWGITDVMAGNAIVLAEIVGGESYMGTCYGSFSLTAGVISLVEEEISSNIETDLMYFSMALIALNVMFALMVYDQKQELYILEFSRKRQEQTSIANFSCNVDEYCDMINPVSTSLHEEVTETSNIVENIALPVESDITSAGETICDNTMTKSNLHASSSYAPLSLDEDASISTKVKSGKSLIYQRMTANCSSPLLILGSVAFLATFCESCFITWIVVYYRDVLQAAPRYHTAGYGCMMTAMAISRFSCDLLRSKFTTRQIVFAAAVLLCTGLWFIFCISFVSNSVVLTSLGTCLVGLGVGPLNPLSFSSAGHLPNLKSSGSAVATVAACAYSGSIISSPLVGLIADATGSLRYGFLFVAMILSALVPLSWLVPAGGI